MAEVWRVVLLLDTNVVLDVLHLRPPWQIEAKLIWDAVSDGRIEACISASALTDIYYLSRKQQGVAGARQVVDTCLKSLTILPVDAGTVRDALQSPIADFEDAVQAAVAATEGVDAIVTRDPKGYVGAAVPVWSPGDVVARLRAAGN